MPATLPNQSPDTPKDAYQPLKIGSVDVDPPVLQAPMAGYTNYAFRQVVREFGGAGLLATEMIAARRPSGLKQIEANTQIACGVCGKSPGRLLCRCGIMTLKIWLK